MSSGLLQEQLNKDPWKIFVCCIFCNLTKRVHAEPYFWEFLEKWSTPEKAAVLNEEELQEMIKPLGLAERRSRSLKLMSIDYLAKNWKDNAKVLYGIGKYGDDAYRIFAKDEWKEVEPTDSALKFYINWKKENENA